MDPDSANYDVVDTEEQQILEPNAPAALEIAPPTPAQYAMPAGVDPRTLAQAIQALAQQGQAPRAETPPAWVDPMSRPEVIEELNAIMFSSPADYHRRMGDIMQERMMQQMQPTFAAANNSAFVENQLIGQLEGRYGAQMASQFRDEALGYIRQARADQPQAFNNPQQVIDAVTTMLDAKAFRAGMQAQQSQARQVQAPAAFGSSLGSPAPTSGAMRPRISRDVVAQAEAFGLDPVKLAAARARLNGRGN